MEEIGKEDGDSKESGRFLKWVFQVLYTPREAFGEIVEKPSVKGPILILLITLPIILGGQYVSGAKFFLETPSPENDLWTENSSESHTFLWSSGNGVIFNDGDYVAGNYSVSVSLTNSSLIWLRLTSIGTFNCSEEGHNRLSFRIKWVNEKNVPPANAVLQLFSFNNESRKFELHINDIIANNTNIWANVTVDLATAKWVVAEEHLPSWTNVTGIGFQLVWDDPTSLTMKIDDLFFGRYIPVISSNVFGTQIAYSLVRNGINFLLEWVILSSVVFLALKSFSDYKGSWKNLLYVMGYVYSPSIIYLAALAVLFFYLPPFYIPYSITYLEYLELYQSSWGLPISVLNLLFYLWITGLCVVALRRMHESSWSKALLVGFGAVVISLLLSSVVVSVFF